MMTTRKIWIITTIFLAVLTGFRYWWLESHSADSYPVAAGGVLDLRGWEPLTEHSLPLNGEWLFYPDTLLYSDGTDDTADRPHSEGRPIQVPGSWSFDDRPKGSEKYGYGTYRLRILVDSGRGKEYGVRVTSVKSSSEVYVNGQSIGRSGQPADSQADYKPLDVPYTVKFSVGEGIDEIDLVIQAANFDNRLNGGIFRSIKFGLETTLSRDTGLARDMVWVACVAYAIHVLYGFVLYLVGGRDRRLIYYSLMIVCIIMATLLDGERLLYVWIPFPFVWSLKSIYLVMISGGFFLYQLVKEKVPFVHRRVSRIYELLCGIAFISVLVLPLSAALSLQGGYLILMFIPCLMTPVLLFRSAVRIDMDNIFLLLAATAAINSLIWLVVMHIAGIELISYPFDLIIAMICFSAYWFRRYIRMSEESKELTNKLRQAGKQKDEFLSTVAHELRNPLHGLINISQSVAAREQSKLGIDSVSDLQMLVKVGRRMSYLLNDLLDMARLRDNRIHLQLADLSVHSVASGVMDMLRFMTEGKPLRLVNRIPAEFPLVHADENRLNQILFNLLHNAVKYSNAGEVSVQAEADGGWAVVSVSDTGLGMDEELLSRVFEPYEQVSPDKGSRSGGFGLGLNICKQLVEMHGGTLTVRSKLHEGSVFTFRLKLAADREEMDSAVQQTAAADSAYGGSRGSSQETAPANGPARSPAPERLRLLAVDDDPVNLNVLKAIFAEEPYELFTAIGGKEALRLLETGVWDLIISDVMMPIMSGYELTERVRERYSVEELPILLLTASSQDQDIEAGFRAGANDYVTKPVNAIELKARVRSLTNLRKSVGERLRMEAALLQAQIKPHFLINTFNAVTALSRIDKDRMDDLVEELTTYIKYGIDFQNSDGAVPLDHELKLVRSYLNIQQERFEERLRVAWEIDDHVTVFLPPLTIQPLVENAVTHGILKRRSGGEVRIRISDLGAAVEICVSDNGTGIDEDTVKQLLNRNKNKRSGIGLLNTDRRLKQFTGHGLRIESRTGAGTSVSFTVAKTEQRLLGSD
ncbi:MAG: hypothetical protein K0Q94_3595 [Paenibacillus sp.]|uniref:hybrid sensor histidine kinase/response regulator n=1 Tax=Paenibacillus sp. GCM10012303 TaxID=3317340 RepID=UPI0029EE145C|nr:hypothetical protein [Paenibacillus sp.]